MKHATPATVLALSPLLQALRTRLVERTPGAFYYRSKAFLHFHEDATGIYADVKLDLTTFSRERVTSQTEQTALLVRIDQVLAPTNRA